jgi:hypothetical protein
MLCSIKKHIKQSNVQPIPKNKRSIIINRIRWITIQKIKTIIQIIKNIEIKLVKIKKIKITTI